MISRLIHLRCKQILRIVLQAGWVMTLVALILISGLILNALESVLHWPAYLSVVVGILTLLILQKQRRDIQFLQSIMHSMPRLALVLGVEYILLLSPILIFQLCQGHILLVTFLILGIGSVAVLHPWFNVSPVKALKNSASWIPLKNFEIKCVVERNLWGVCLIYLISWLGAYHVAFFLISAVIFGLLLISAFEFNEPREMVFYTPYFLKSKFADNLNLISRWYVAPALVTIFFQQEFLWLIFYGFLFLIAVLFMAIAYKYAHYTPLTPYSQSSQLLSILFLLGLIPGGILIVIFYTGWKFRQAQKNLKYYYVAPA